MKTLLIILFSFFNAVLLHAQNSPEISEPLDTEIFIQEGLIYPFDLTIVDGWLFVKEIRESTGKYGIVVFDAQSGEKVYEFIRQGRGPGEYLGFNIRKGPKPHQLEITGSRLKKSDIYSVSCLQKKPPASRTPTCIEKTVPNMTSREAIILTDELVFNTGAQSHGVLYLSEEDRIIQKIDSIPDELSEMYKRPNAASLAMAGFIASNPERNKFAFFAKYYDKYSFYKFDPDNKSLSTIYEKDYSWLPKFNINDYGASFTMTPSAETKFGYRAPTRGRQHVFVPFSGKSNEDIEVSETVEWRAFTKLIKVFDWEGNEMKQLKLNHKVYYITVDDAENTLYGVHYNNDEIPAIIKASLQ